MRENKQSDLTTPRNNRNSLLLGAARGARLERELGSELVLHAVRWQVGGSVPYVSLCLSGLGLLLMCFTDDLPLCGGPSYIFSSREYFEAEVIQRAEEGHNEAKPSPQVVPF
ncbi:hypothetical protein AMECASPLE_024144 [Ameca splendens]|uniref:Uncharacterized protein n=1 Tax=Ameca splendens TaxID=208324 RepID=A0ABV0ZPQ5_9TELE